MLSKLYNFFYRIKFFNSKKCQINNAAANFEFKHSLFIEKKIIRDYHSNVCNLVTKKAETLKLHAKQTKISFSYTFNQSIQFTGFKSSKISRHCLDTISCKLPS